jgi:hypothetical protein
MTNFTRTAKTKRTEDVIVRVGPGRFVRNTDGGGTEWNREKLVVDQVSEFKSPAFTVKTLNPPDPGFCHWSQFSHLH